MSRKSNEEIREDYKGKNKDDVTRKYFDDIWYSEENKKKRERGNAYLILYKDFVNFSEKPESLAACVRKDNVCLYRVLQAWLDLQAWKKIQPVLERLSLWKNLPAWEEWKKATFPIDIYYKNENDKPIGEIENEEFRITKNGNKEKYKEYDIDRQKVDLGFLEGIDIDILNPDNNREDKANQKWHLYVSYFAGIVVWGDSRVCENENEKKITINDFDWKNGFDRVIKCGPLLLWMIENTEGQEDFLKKIEESIDQGKNVIDPNKKVYYTIKDKFSEIRDGLSESDKDIIYDIIKKYFDKIKEGHA